MRRNRAGVVKREMERIAQRAAETPERRAAAAASTSSARKVGAIDPDTGEMAFYGLVGLTKIRDFRVRG